MSLKWPDLLVEAIARRRAVILIGSGVSANAQTISGDRPPTWGRFLIKAYSSLGRRLPHIANALRCYNYLEACDFLKNEHGQGNWHEIIRENFVNPQYRPSELHKNIFNLDCRIVASLNFDKVYENHALPASENTVVVKNYYDPDIRQAVADTGRYIIKPHGSVDAMSKMIFTLDDYARARIEYSSFYSIITALLHTHTFICIGCGLSDPDMKLLFEDYRYRYGESPHFMTIPNPISVAEMSLIEKTRGIKPLPYSPRNHHEELTSSVKELVLQVAAKREDIASTREW